MAVPGNGGRLKEAVDFVGMLGPVGKMDPLALVALGGRRGQQSEMDLVGKMDPLIRPDLLDNNYVDRLALMDNDSVDRLDLALLHYNWGPKELRP